MVRKVLALVEAWGCMWFMENPYTGLLKTRAVVAGLPYQIVDYCQWRDDRWTRMYRKPTAIWSNTGWRPEKPRCRRRSCKCVEGGRHREQVRFEEYAGKNAYAIPPLLCESVRDHCAAAVAVA